MWRAFGAQPLLRNHLINVAWCRRVRFKSANIKVTRQFQYSFNSQLQLQLPAPAPGDKEEKHTQNKDKRRSEGLKKERYRQAKKFGNQTNK